MTRNTVTQVGPEIFKQLILDAVMKSQKMMMPEVREELTAIISNYAIGPMWKNMADGKPTEKTGWYWIKIKKERQFENIMPAKRVNGGFLCGLLPNQSENSSRNRVYMIPDLSVEQYAPISMPG